MRNYLDHTYGPYKFVRLQPLQEGEADLNPHRHRCFECFFFTKAAYKHQIDFETFEVPAGEIHLIRPDGVHLLQRTYSTTGYVLLFSREFHSSYARVPENWFLLIQQILKHGPVLKPAADRFEQLRGILEMIGAQWVQAPSRLRDELIHHYIEAVILILLDEFKKSQGTQPILTERERLSIDYLRYVEDHFMKYHELDFYCKKLNATTNTLYKAVKEIMEKPPLQVLHERILLEAKRLLFHSNLSVKEITWQLGFEDDAYFNRFFKKNTGLTALDFRTESRAGRFGGNVPQ